MKVEYKGYEIEVVRERCLGGWDMLYYRIFRISDGYCCVDNFTTGSDTVREYIGYMKERIDEEHRTDDPWGEKAEGIAA